MVRRLPIVVLACAALVAGAAFAASAFPDTREAPAPAARVPAAPPPGEGAPVTVEAEPPPAAPGIRWRRSRALGTPEDGRLLRGIRLPAEGSDYFTWDPIHSRSPNRAWRRHGSDRLVRVLLRALAGYAHEHPGAPRVGIGDLSRPRGGDFGPRYGIVGHASHQNGLDADLYHPRRDGRERPALLVADMDRRLAQDLVDALVRAGASEILVGPSTGLRGPRSVVREAAGHDNHLHVRVAG
ncbi:MAG: penicillin-insensitive murein endopeptidase [Thermoleophilaceae bacterium]